MRLAISESVANRIKSDGPTRRIVAELRNIGASVAYIKSRPGSGCAGLPDLAVGFLGRNFFLEVKSPGEDLKPAQKKFHLDWKGAPISVVSSELEALIAIGLVP